jgi:selT/selW/selH-like putative selenoprotein
LADVIEKTRGMRPTLVAGARGAFEVFVDDKRIFSKLAAGRFPTPEEILAALPSA